MSALQSRSKSFSYSDSLGQKFWKASVMSYCDQSALQAMTCHYCNDYNLELLHFYTSPGSSVFNDVLSFAMLVDHDNHQFITSFKGSNSNGQLVNQLIDNSMVSYTINSLSAGVLDYAYDSYKDNLRSEFQTKYQEYTAQYPSYDAIITGHSLGGALAEHAAVDASFQGYKEPFVITYGAPRVGDHRWASKVNTLTHYRVVNDRDIIVHYPFCKSNIWTGKCQTTNNKPYHSDSQIFYQGTSWQSCSAESSSCANKHRWVWDWSIDDHNDYFDGI